MAKISFDTSDLSWGLIMFGLHAVFGVLFVFLAGDYWVHAVTESLLINLPLALTIFGFIGWSVGCGFKAASAHFQAIQNFKICESDHQRIHSRLDQISSQLSTVTATVYSLVGKPRWVLALLVITPALSLNCTFKDTKVTVQPCLTTVEAMTVYGTFDLKCSELQYQIFFGPVIFSAGNESCHVIANEMNEVLIDQHSFTLECRKSHSSAFKAIISFLVITILILCCMTRLAFRLKKVRGEGKIVYMKAGPNKGEIKILKPNSTNYYSKLGFLIFLLLKTSDAVLVPKGGFFNVGQLSVHVMEAHFVPNLDYSYYTSSFSHKIKSNWHCYESVCSEVISCGTSGVHGIPDKAMRVEDSKWVATINFCNYGVRGCLTWHGCIKWSVSFIIDTRFTKVFTVNSISSVLTISKQGESPDCKVSSARISNEPVLANHGVLTHMGEFYMCPYVSTLNMPMAGAIGELQMDNETNFLVDPMMVSCTTSESVGAQCNWRDSSLEKVISKSCIKIPGTLGGYKYEWKRGMIAIEQDILVDISLDCREIQFNTTGCSGVSVRYHGSDFSNEGALVSVSPNVEHPKGEWVGTLPCVSSQIAISCNSEPKLIVVPDTKFCRSEYQRMGPVAVASSSLIDESFGGFTDENAQSSNSFSAIMSSIMHSPFLWSLNSSAIILVIIILLLLRR